MTLINVIRRTLSPIFYPPRVVSPETDVTEDEIEAWVEASGLDHFATLDGTFVDRSVDLGVESGMIFDLGSRLGLIALKILWNHEDFVALGLHRTAAMADRARDVTLDWELGERMFLQVGEPHEMRFKTGYFDMVVCDRSLHRFDNPVEILREINRITKPSGAILIRVLARPSRLSIESNIRKHALDYPESLRGRFEAEVRAGFTVTELRSMVEATELKRTRVVAEQSMVLVERRGVTDFASWVTERDKYF